LKKVSNIVLPLAQSGIGRPTAAAASAANMGAKLASKVTIFYVSTIFVILLLTAFPASRRQNSQTNLQSKILAN
jgi:hypothetical protein